MVEEEEEETHVDAAEAMGEGMEERDGNDDDMDIEQHVNGS